MNLIFQALLKLAQIAFEPSGPRKRVRRPL